MTTNAFETYASGPDALLLDTPAVNSIKVRIIKERNYDVPSQYMKTINQEVIFNLILDYENESPEYKTKEKEEALRNLLIMTQSRITNFKHFMLAIIEMQPEAIKWLYLYDNNIVNRVGKTITPLLTYDHVLSIISGYILHNEPVPDKIVYLMMHVLQGKYWFVRTIKRTIDSISIIYHDCLRICGDNKYLMDNIYPALYDLCPGYLDRLHAEARGVSLNDYWSNGGSWIPEDSHITMVYQYLLAKAVNSPHIELHHNMHNIMYKWINCFQKSSDDNAILLKCQDLIIRLVRDNANNVDFISWTLFDSDYRMVTDMLLGHIGTEIKLRSISQYRHFKQYQYAADVSDQDIIKLVKQNIPDIPYTTITPYMIDAAFTSYSIKNLTNLLVRNPKIINTDVDIQTYACNRMNAYSAITNAKLTQVLFSEDVFRGLSGDNINTLLHGKDLSIIYDRYPWTIKYVPEAVLTPIDVKAVAYKNPEILKYVSTSKLPTDIVEHALARYPYIKFNYEDGVDITKIIKPTYLANLLMNGYAYGYIYDCNFTVYRNSFMLSIMFDAE